MINAIRKEDRDQAELLKLSYHEHLWMEREIKTVANVTHFDIAEFLPLAGEIPLEPEVQTYRLEDANRASRTQTRPHQGSQSASDELSLTKKTQAEMVCE